MDELAKRVEAILFASGKGVSEEELAEHTNSSKSKVRQALVTLRGEYEERDSSLVVSTNEETWKLTVRASYTPYIEKLVSEAELAPAVLKTLAVVAYKSPVLQSDVVDLRGQTAYEHVKELAKQKFITKEESGRSYLLRITDKFYNYFDIEGDEEIRDVFSELRSQEERRTAIQKDVEQQKLGNLEVVAADASKDHETIFTEEPRRKEKTEEEKKEEKDFLEDIDKRIQNIASKVQSHELPKRDEEQEEYI